MSDNLLSIPYKKYCYYCGSHIFNKYIYICPVCNLSFCSNHKEPISHKCNGFQKNALPPGITEGDLKKMCTMCGRITHPRECVYCGGLFCEEHISPHDHYCTALTSPISILDEEMTTLLKPAHIKNEESKLGNTEKEKYLSLRGRFCYYCGKTLHNCSYFTCPVCGLSFCEEHKVEHKCTGYNKIKTLPPGIAYRDIESVCYLCGKVGGAEKYERCECGLQLCDEHLEKGKHGCSLEGLEYDPENKYGYENEGIDSKQDGLAEATISISDSDSINSNSISDSKYRSDYTEDLGIVLELNKNSDTSDINDTSNSDLNKEVFTRTIKKSFLNIAYLTVLIFLILSAVYYSFELGIVEFKSPIIDLNVAEFPYVHEENRMRPANTLVTLKKQGSDIEIQKLPESSIGTEMVYQSENTSVKVSEDSFEGLEPEISVSIKNCGHYSVHGTSGVKLSLEFQNKNNFSELVTINSGVTYSGHLLFDRTVTLKEPLDRFVAEPGVSKREYVIPELNIHDLEGDALLLSTELTYENTSVKRELKIPFQ